MSAFYAAYRLPVVTVGVTCRNFAQNSPGLRCICNWRVSAGLDANQPSESSVQPFTRLRRFSGTKENKDAQNDTANRGSSHIGTHAAHLRGLGVLRLASADAHARTRLLGTHSSVSRRKRHEVNTFSTSRSDRLLCPVCEVGELHPFGGDSGRCGSCGCILGTAMLLTLEQISALPDALGEHACECGHPEMRKLPDGTFHCPACRSEVLAIEG